MVNILPSIAPSSQINHQQRHTNMEVPETLAPMYMRDCRSLQASRGPIKSFLVRGETDWMKSNQEIVVDHTLVAR
jgi:hypothetical protein